MLNYQNFQVMRSIDYHSNINRHLRLNYQNFQVMRLIDYKQMDYLLKPHKSPPTVKLPKLSGNEVN